jgi:hypothetical protein
MIRTASRLDLIEPFYVMECAKAADQIARSPACDPAAGGERMIYLNIGEPDFTAAPAVVRAAERCLAGGRTQYTQATGLPALRERIAAWYGTRFGVAVDPARIVVTAGASAALQLACLALFEPGDEVLMPDPSYPCNRHFVSAVGATPRLLPTTAESRYQLDAASVTAHWSAGHARRAAGLAQQPHRHVDRSGRDGAIVQAVRPWRRDAGRRDLPGTELRPGLRAQRAGPGRGRHQHQQLQQVLRDDRLAPGLDGAAAGAGGAGRKAGAEPLHLRQQRGPACGAGLFRSRVDRRIRTPAR